MSLIVGEILNGVEPIYLTPFDPCRSAEFQLLKITVSLRRACKNHQCYKKLHTRSQNFDMLSHVFNYPVNVMASFFKRHTGAVQLAFVVGIVGFAILLSMSLKPDSSNPRPAIQSDEIAVSVVTPAAHPFRPQLRLNGVVQARTTTTVIPQVAGRIIDVSPGFRPGARVNEGDVLFSIDPTDYELAVERTLAEIEIARSDLARLEAEAAAERKVWRGQFPDKPIPDLIARVPQIEAARARIHSGEASRKAAELSLARTVVRAPFNARILETQLDVGQVVNTSSSVGSIFSVDSLEIAVPVSAEERSLIGPIDFQAADIILPAAQGDVLAGNLVRAAAALDERTRLRTLFISAVDQEQLTVGEFVTVEIAGHEAPDSFRLPPEALTSRDRLWVVEDGLLAARIVDVIGQEADMTVVREFDTADGVLTVPPSNVREGLPVRARQTAELASALVIDFGIN